MGNKKNYEQEHLRNLERYMRQIDAIYNQAIRQAGLLGASIPAFNPNKPFQFKDYPSVKARIDKLISDFYNSTYSSITNGIDAEWSLANNKNNELARAVFGSHINDISKRAERKYFSNNIKAKEAFVKRKVNGLDLSGRIWNYTGQFKQELEMGLDIGLRTGRSADELSRDLRGYLKNPDTLFRRVRDEHGNLQLSKNAKAYHPGQGVYRSSYKNARRLTATENNMAYRTANHERIQQFDFVLGIEIKLSNNHTLNGEPFYDICDELEGKYPKEFKFTGWHPHCRCMALTILADEMDFAASLNNMLAGDDVEFKGQINNTPSNFNKWIQENDDRIKRAKSLPYFLRDNKQYLKSVPKPKAKPKIVKPMTKVPRELQEGSPYLRGADIKFKDSFFALLDPKRPVQLSISTRGRASHYNHIDNSVFILNNERRRKSLWNRESLIYHEYGHAIDHHRGLKKMVSGWMQQLKQDLSKSSGKYAVTKRFNPQTMEVEQYKKRLSKIAYIDGKLERLLYKVLDMNDATFTKRGITKSDVLEQIGAVRDTIMAIKPNYGFGHTKAYFRLAGKKEAEFIAHAFENAFSGNRIFEKYMPELYEEMINFINELKPM